MLILNGYEYKVLYRTEDKSYWRCKEIDKLHCKARLMTTGRVLNVKTSVGHNHQPTFAGSYDQCTFQKLKVYYMTHFQGLVYFYDSKRKHPMLMFNNYEYKSNNQCKGKSYWRCKVVDGRACRAKLMTSGKCLCVKTSEMHNHPPTFDGNYEVCKAQTLNVRYMSSFRKK
ncbi:hypothetical protein GWI33_002754 [Rhynchophorus ferrugineus]|uniref:FLYWCH-type domain-containing protein n=1 Tax=Rhynchophorus ferrugineus TaxID=354439 RepID=A0A834IK35_RHYFE|nr:hypothetical protein GWI33_002754 [Rhynchophorus ferrugineus]